MITIIKKFYKWIALIFGIILISLLINTNTGKNYVNYIKDNFTKDYTNIVKTLEEEKNKFEHQSDTYKALYEDLQKDKDKLVKERNTLKVKINSLSVELKTIQEKKKNIQDPKDIYEASKTLNNLGYTNTITDCQ